MIQRVHSVGFTVSDLASALDFYTTVLPFEIIHEAEEFGEPYEALTGITGAQMVTLQLGREHIQLTAFSAPGGGRPIPADSRSNDLWFQHVAIVVSDMDAAYARLRTYDVKHVSTAPQTLPGYITAAAGIRAFYFRDPDRHNLELIWYPQGKGDPRWQRQDRLFLGIDHTAIGIAQTERSLKFYRDTLGFAVAGESENYGTEQEHLNGVPGARLRITGLKAREDGIGVEFLDYLTPPGGRPMPVDTRPNDHWFWHMTMLVPDVQAAHARLMSDSIVTLPDGESAFLVRDPDGHFVKLVEGV